MNVCIIEMSAKHGRGAIVRRARWSYLRGACMLAFAMLSMLPELSAQTIADYANSDAHLTIGSATGSVADLSGRAEGQAPADVLVTAVAMAEDPAGNLYYSQGSEIDMYYTADINGQVPPLLKFAGLNSTPSFTPQKGKVYSIAGSISGVCGAGSSCGDGSYAAQALLGFVAGIQFDAAGNLYLADEALYAIRKIDPSTGFIGTIAGDAMHANSSTSGDGGLASSATLVAPSALAIQGANIYIADIGANLVRKIDGNGKISTIAGDITQPPGTYCSDSNCGEGQAALGSILGGVSSIAVNAAGDVYISEEVDNVVRKFGADGKLHTVAGTRGAACSGSGCGDNGPATSALLNLPLNIALDSDGDVIIADVNDNAIRAVRNSDQMVFTIVGSITASSTASQAQEAALDGSPALKLMLTTPQYAFVDSAKKLSVADTNLLWQVDAPTTKLAQTIEFDSLASIDYGTTSITLTARSLDGSNNPTNLPITYSVSPASLATVNGSTITIKGAGDITITASQPGSSTYSPAAPVTQTLAVLMAPLTVQADNLSFPFNSSSTLPQLTYHLVGLVPGDTAANAVTGAPVLQTTAKPTSAPGKYPITIGLGTLTSVNYSLTTAEGVLSIVGGQAQSITFNSLPNVTYGAPAIALTASASSNLPITYTYSGPANLLGSRLVVNGVGTVTVTATQTGNSTYGPASDVTQSFQVLPATLTITANNALREYNQPDPAFSFTATGFVNGDTAAVLSGVPGYLPPAANATPGQYTLGLASSGGTLFAKNYTFHFVSGTLIVTKASQAINFAQIKDVAYDTQGILWNATSSSGLPVSVSASGPIRYTNLSFDAIPADGIPRVGAVTATATQAGNDLYQAATPLTQTFQVVKASLQVNANDVSRAFGAANPPFTYYFGGSSSVVIPANAYSGIPALTTTADTNFPPGNYPIVVTQGTFLSPVYNLVFVNGTLTVLPKSSFTLTANPSAVTVSVGQSSSVKLTLTPINDFSSSVTVSCNGLPAGLNCVLSPQTLTPTITGNQTGPASGVLTITAAGASASLKTEPTAFAADLLWLPGGVAGLLLFLCRKRLASSLKAQRMLLIVAMLLGLSGMVACGGSSKSGGTATPGTSTVQVIGTGTAPDGSQVVNQLDLTVTVQ